MADEEGERKPTLENFLAGVPLNKDMEDLARAVMEDGEPEAEPGREVSADPFDPLRPCDDADRKALLKLTQEPGWEVLTRLRRIACAEAEKAATLVSQDNPFGNKDKIAAGWAYFAVMKQILQVEKSMIETELQQLRQQKKKRPTQ